MDFRNNKILLIASDKVFDSNAGWGKNVNKNGTDKGKMYKRFRIIERDENVNCGVGKKNVYIHRLRGIVRVRDIQAPSGRESLIK